jgi:hypothetical protein
VPNLRGTYICSMRVFCFEISYYCRGNKNTTRTTPFKIHKLFPFQHKLPKGKDKNHSCKVFQRNKLPRQHVNFSKYFVGPQARIKMHAKALDLLVSLQTENLCVPKVHQSLREQNRYYVTSKGKSVSQLG